jgi:hypothetical protein
MYESAFGTVGDSPLSYVGSGAAHPNSKYTKSVPKGTMGRGSSPTGTMASRSNIKLNEADGPKCSIQATLYHANAPEASAQMRNTKLVPSKAGIGDFWNEKMRSGQVI